jgi:hypothetical protein
VASRDRARLHARAIPAATYAGRTGVIAQPRLTPSSRDEYATGGRISSRRSSRDGASSSWTAWRMLGASMPTRRTRRSGSSSTSPHRRRERRSNEGARTAPRR